MSIVKLNLLMSYPVRWGMYKVMRDFIQNFYDSIGCDHFGNRFKHEYNVENGELKMVSAQGFAKEWLFYLGASTKRDSEGKYAGKFGEGFKIASLVALRDYKLSVVMESLSWKIIVTTAEEIIDGQKVSCLAYDVSESADFNGARLTLTGVNSEGYSLFLRAMNGFYFKGNPIFGDKIYEGSCCALYGTKQEENGHFREGHIFAGYQDRCSIKYPLIFCDHTFSAEGDDRDRDELTGTEMIRCIDHVLQHLNPLQAMEALERLKPFWHGKRKRNCKIHPQFIIRSLIETIHQDNVEIEMRFCQKYGDRIIADCHRITSTWNKKIARSWFRYSGLKDHFEIVMSSFSVLGIRDIEQLCREAGGFEMIARAEGKEKECIGILEKAAIEHFSDIIQYEQLPECWLIINPDAPIDGEAHVLKPECRKKNGFGLRTESNIEKICLKKETVLTGSFGKAFSVYLHELLHQYGGDCSAQFHRALKEMNIRLLEREMDIQEYKKQWEEVHAGNRGENG